MIDDIVNKAVAAAVFFILLGSVVITQYQDAQSAVSDNPEISAFLLLAMLLFVIGVAMKFHD